MDKNCSNLKKRNGQKKTSRTLIDFDQYKFKENQTETQYKTVKYLIENVSRISREKTLNTFSLVPLILSTDVFKDILQFRVWDDIFKYKKKKNYQPRTLYMAKLSLKHQGEIKIFFFQIS